MPNDMEYYDPKEKKQKFYSERERKKKRRSSFTQPRMMRFFASKPFMLGYGLFLMAAISLIMLYQNGKLGTYVKREIEGVDVSFNFENGNESVNLEFQMQNKAYKDTLITNILIIGRLYRSERLIAEEKAPWKGRKSFVRGEYLGYTFYFDKGLFNRADSFEIYYQINRDKALFHKEISDI